MPCCTVSRECSCGARRRRALIQAAGQHANRPADGRLLRAQLRVMSGAPLRESSEHRISAGL